MVTDLDVLAFRFPGAGPADTEPGRGSPLVSTLVEPDPALGGRRRDSDMIVAEVKEGRAELNRGGRDPRVLQAALVRFGCCELAEAERVVRGLIDTGEVATEHGHRIRLMAFGSTLPSGDSGPYKAISLGHVVSFLRNHLRGNWDILRHAQVSDPALGFSRSSRKGRAGVGHHISTIASSSFEAGQVRALLRKARRRTTLALIP